MDTLLVINADDFGLSRGINRGIIEAHQRGVVTSASLMVDAPRCHEAVAMGRGCPRLGLGFHFVATDERGPLYDLDDVELVRSILATQFERFVDAVGALPTHLDSHHDVHRDPRLLPYFLDLARRHGLPLRGHSPVRCLSKFYGQWGGVSHPEQVSAANLVRMLKEEVGEGLTELICHPGYADPDFPSSYSAEREEELRALCDPAVRAALGEQGIVLIGFGDLGPPGPGSPA
jgi:predicted glycoside hydrolase/deacetylase ChbG (UPF0249 family)